MLARSLIVVATLALAGAGSTAADTRVGPHGRDLRVTIDASSQVTVGNGPGEATVVVGDAGPAAARKATLRITATAGLKITSAPAGCRVKARLAICRLGRLAGTPPRTTQSAPPPVVCACESTVRIRFEAIAAGSGRLVARASAAGRDANPADNVAASAITMPPGPALADLQVTLSAPHRVAVGDQLVYEIRVRNAGPSEARVVRLHTDRWEPVPLSMLAVTAGTGGNFCRPYPWDFRGDLCFEPLLPGETAQAQIGVRPTDSDVGVLTASAAASSPTLDPDDSNNAATATTAVAR